MNDNFGNLLQFPVQVDSCRKKFMNARNGKLSFLICLATLASLASVALYLGGQCACMIVRSGSHVRR